MAGHAQRLRHRLGQHHDAAYTGLTLRFRIPAGFLVALCGQQGRRYPVLLCGFDEHTAVFRQPAFNATLESLDIDVVKNTDMAIVFLDKARISAAILAFVEPFVDGGV